MFLVGKVGVQAAKLVDVTYECMMRGIELVKPGIRLGDIGHAIQILCGEAPLFGGARFLRPRHRAGVP